MPAFVIRPYQAADAAQMLEVIKRAFQEQDGKVNPPSSAARKTLAILQNELQSAEAFVAEQDQQVVGCIMYEPKEDALYFSRLAVLPAQRKQGIARALIAAVESEAKALALPLNLSVRISLGEQRTYYERLGYRVVGTGTHEGFSEPTYFKMRKDLS
jgi:predicted N-acetyltransferase YhbS